MNREKRQRCALARCTVICYGRWSQSFKLYIKYEIICIVLPLTSAAYSLYIVAFSFCELSSKRLGGIPDFECSIHSNEIPMTSQFLPFLHYIFSERLLLVAGSFERMYYTLRDYQSCHLLQLSSSRFFLWSTKLLLNSRRLLQYRYLKFNWMLVTPATSGSAPVAYSWCTCVTTRTYSYLAYIISDLADFDSFR